MGRTLEEGINPTVRSFIERQRVFYVATAPNDKDLYVNVSPKTPGSAVQVLGPHFVAFADMSGSGSETAAHVLQNGRITFMWLNMDEGSPQIIRVFGSATIVLPDEASTELLGCFPRSIVDNPGFRSIFVIKVTRVSTSCGYSIPVFSFKRNRTTMDDFARKTEKRGYMNGLIPGGMVGYRAYKNCYSIDGLPSISLTIKEARPMKMVPTKGFNFAVKFEPDEQGTTSEANARALMETAQQSPARRLVELPPMANRPCPVEMHTGFSMWSDDARVTALILAALALGGAVGFAVGKSS
jgi:hypothetical protein